MYSIEFVGHELDVSRARGAQEANGSIGNSPSATAFYLNQADNEDEATAGYISDVMDRNGSGAVFSFPLEVFERTWVLYNLEKAGLLGALRPESRPHIDYLRDSWHETKGVSFSRFCSAFDLDDTATAFRVLHRASRIHSDPRYRVAIDVFRAYEQGDHYRTFPFETDPSISSNVHLLDALSTSGDCSAGPMIDIILRFIRRTRSLGAFWFDKWHASPYYATSHAVLACTEVAPDLVEDAICWILGSQREDGSWGYFSQATAEETAYCLQALMHHVRSGGKACPKALGRAACYLRLHSDVAEHPPLWIAKSLFAPQRNKESATLSALTMYEGGI